MECLFMSSDDEGKKACMIDNENSLIHTALGDTLSLQSMIANKALWLKKKTLSLSPSHNDAPNRIPPDTFPGLKSLNMNKWECKYGSNSDSDTTRR